MKKIYFAFFVVFMGAIIIGCASSSNQNQTKKYIFYFIGDGMGLAQSHAAELYLAALDQSNDFPFLHMNRLPHHTYFTTHADNRYITGSAASGTAMASGAKTTINTIGMDSDHLQDLNSISDKAKSKGMKVGIISSVSIDHATPASFYAHEDHRNKYYEIGLDLVESGFDFFGGGGFRYPDGPDGTADTNIINYAKEKGYTYITRKEDFQNLQPENKKYLVINNDLDEGAAMPYSMDQNNKDLSLKELLSKAIELLDNEKGFFIMLEGGKIDWACHQNDAAATIHDVIAFDEAVGVALEFYEKHPDETVILVGADHETGGLALGNSLTKYEIDYALVDYQNASMDVMVEKFSKIENLDFDKAMQFIKEELSLNDTVEALQLTSYDKKRLKKAFYARQQPETIESKEEYYDLYGSYDPFIIESLRIFNGKIGISYSSWSHTGIPVPLRYVGLDGNIFNGLPDNTALPKVLEKALQVSP